MQLVWKHKPQELASTEVVCINMAQKLEEELLPFVTEESWVPLTSKKKVTSMRSLPSRSLTVRESLAGRRNNSVTVVGSHRKHQYQTLWNWFPDFDQIRNGILCNSSSHNVVNGFYWPQWIWSYIWIKMLSGCRALHCDKSHTQEDSGQQEKSHKHARRRLQT